MLNCLSLRLVQSSDSSKYSDQAQKEKTFIVPLPVLPTLISTLILLAEIASPKSTGISTEPSMGVIPVRCVYFNTSSA